MSDERVVVVDGSNLATEGRTTPSLQQLDEAVRAYADEDPDAEIVVVVDASFEHRVDAAERAALEEAELHGEVVSPPAGAIGRGDAFVLRIAERTGAAVLSNDSFQEFHGEHPWLFDEGRLIGGKPVPGVGWIFTPRIPVRGPKSRQATSRARRSAAEPLSPPVKAAELARAARKAAARRMAVMPDGSPPKVGDVWGAPGPGVAGEVAAVAEEVAGEGAAELAGAKGAAAVGATEGKPAPARASAKKSAKKAAKKAAAKKTPAKRAAAQGEAAKGPAADEETAKKEAAKQAPGKKAAAKKEAAKQAPGKKAAAKKEAAKQAPGKKAPTKKTAAKKAAGTQEAAAGREAVAGEGATEAPAETQAASTRTTGRGARKAADRKRAPARPTTAAATEAATEAGPAKKATRKARAKKATAEVATAEVAEARAPSPTGDGVGGAGGDVVPPGTSRRGTRPSRPRDDPAVRDAIDEATAEALEEETEEPATARGDAGRGGDDGGPAGDGSRDGRGSRRRRRRTAGSPPAANESLAFITFVATYPIGSELEGEVVAFTSHGAMVDVGLPEGGVLHCYIPLTAMADPPPTKARQVMSRGARRSFVLVGLDPPRRVAELAVPGVPVATSEPE